MNRAEFSKEIRERKYKTYLSIQENYRLWEKGLRRSYDHLDISYLMGEEAI